MKGVPHYTKDGLVFTGATHKMADGSLHTGSSHNASSRRLFHMDELSDVAKKKAMRSRGNFKRSMKPPTMSY